MTEFKFTIDGKECVGRTGQTIIEAAGENGVYIPSLCRFEGLKPTGSCRVCHGPGRPDATWPPAPSP